MKNEIRRILNDGYTFDVGLVTLLCLSTIFVVSLLSGSEPSEYATATMVLFGGIAVFLPIVHVAGVLLVCESENSQENSQQN